MAKKIQKITAKAIFKRGNNILFVKDIKGVWELPGGKIKFGENPVNALRRELKEELGWKNIKVGEIINICGFSSSRDKTDYHFIVLVYQCFSQEKNIATSNEFIDYKWIPITKVESLKTRGGYKKTIKKFLNRYKS
jgi:8-oxo-dGTP diphosphatase